MARIRETKEVFIKDEVVETVLDLVFLSFILYIPCLYILEHIERWTNLASLLLMNNHLCYV